MLSGNCTEALSIQANVTISGSSAKLIKNDIAPLPFPLPALLKQYWYIKRGERVGLRGHAPFYATLGSSDGGIDLVGQLRRTDQFDVFLPSGLNHQRQFEGQLDCCRLQPGSRRPRMTRINLKEKRVIPYHPI